MITKPQKNIDDLSTLVPGTLLLVTKGDKDGIGPPAGRVLWVVGYSSELDYLIVRFDGELGNEWKIVKRDNPKVMRTPQPNELIENMLVLR